MNSINITMAKNPTPEQARIYMLAILEAWESALDRGYTLTIEGDGE
jgi:hypothetical protein